MESNYGISECTPGSLIAANRHFFSPSQCGFLLCLGGSLTVTMLGVVYKVVPRDLMVFHPFVRAEYTDVSADMRGYIGEVDFTDILPVVNQVVNSENLMKMRKSPVVSLSARQVDTLVSHILRYREAERAARQTAEPELDVLNAAMARNCGSIVMFEVLRQYFTNRRSANTEISVRDIVFQRFMLDVQKYCMERRDTVFYARRSRLSPKYFSTMIREHSGVAPSEWIIQNVIAEAKHLLSDVSLSVKEIAESMNFPSQADFTKYFRRYTGQTPTGFRASDTTRPYVVVS